MQLRSIAYVDDEPDLREVVQLALSLMTGATVHGYESGKQALEQLPASRPDLVLLDVMMPGMDGTEVIQRMKDDPALKAIPVIFMTARAMPEEVARFRALGAIGVIAKPFDPTRLGQEVLAHWQAVARVGGEARITTLASSLATRFAHRTLAELPGMRESSIPEQLKRWIHKVRGTAATIGLPDISARAAEIEDFLSSNASALTDPVAADRFAGLLAALEANLTLAVGSRE
jgi:two-component system, OmpR family, response regulator